MVSLNNFLVLAIASSAAVVLAAPSPDPVPEPGARGVGRGLARLLGLGGKRNKLGHSVGRGGGVPKPKMPKGKSDWISDAADSMFGNGDDGETDGNEQAADGDKVDDATKNGRAVCLKAFKTSGTCMNPDGTRDEYCLCYYKDTFINDAEQCQNSPAWEQMRPYLSAAIDTCNKFHEPYVPKSDQDAAKDDPKAEEVKQPSSANDEPSSAKDDGSDADSEPTSLLTIIPLPKQT